MAERMEGHGGDFIAEALRANGVEQIYTLSGGHIFPIYDGFHSRGMRIIDTRHEQTAGFAAEAHAKLTRGLGVTALTAGPGVTNGMSPLTSAWFNGTPLLMLGGRAPQMRWGQGSLQEMDHVPLVREVTKAAQTVFDASQIGNEMVEATRIATTPHRGPVFLDFPLEVIFSRAEADRPQKAAPTKNTHVGGDADAATITLSEAERPVILAGSDVWMHGAANDLQEFATRHEIPVFMNGMGRGVLPADHGLAFSASRGHAFGRADLVIVVGTSLDFRVGFGSFGSAKVIHVVDDESLVAEHVDLAAGLWTSSIGNAFEALSEAKNRDRSAWVAELRRVENEKRGALYKELHLDATPIHPARVYGELVPRLKRDSIVICDGGDFVSYAGKFVDVYEPGGWLDPGPYGCLGTGPGYALAAGVLYPDRQIVMMLGDGAAGFGMGDWDTLVRFGINVTIVCGNNGIWGLEKHPMRFLYGYDVAAELRPETRYDEVMTALGGHGELVRSPAELGPALDRALATAGPSLVNVITDPAVAYPRSANLA
ncbi:MAG: acetolactate synthase [Actinomycetota bacterium]|nr:acetolactate synthase [Actinomycetota bacterium]